MFLPLSWAPDAGLVTATWTEGETWKLTGALVVVLPWLSAAMAVTLYIALAYASESWLRTKASFALSGIEMTDEDAERAGRLLAGAISFEEGLAEMRSEAGVQRP
jgi:hypothetical protein